MKLTHEEIKANVRQTIKEIAEAGRAAIDSSSKSTNFRDLQMLPEGTEEFARQITDSAEIMRHIHAAEQMEELATRAGIPTEPIHIATFVAAAWIGYKLREGEEAKEQVADLERMAS